MTPDDRGRDRRKRERDREEGLRPSMASSSNSSGGSSSSTSLSGGSSSSTSSSGGSSSSVGSSGSTTNGGSCSYDSLKNLRQISSWAQYGLIYLMLCCALGASAVGAYLHILMNIGGYLTIFGVNSGLQWLLLTPIHYERKSLGILMGLALLHGATVGSLIQRVIEIDPSILVLAFGWTVLALGCFSAIAILAKQGKFLYLRCPLGRGLSILLMLRFASSLFGSTAALSFEVYAGMIILLGYVVFDTQTISMRAHRGELDYVKKAWVFFVDFVGILVRMQLIIGRAHLVDLDYVDYTGILFRIGLFMFKSTRYCKELKKKLDLEKEMEFLKAGCLTENMWCFSI